MHFFGIETRGTNALSNPVAIHMKIHVSQLAEERLGERSPWN